VPIKEWSLGLESEAAYWRLMTASGWVFRARNNSTTKVKTSFKKKVYDYSADLNARLDHMKPFLFEPELLSTADTGQKIFRVLDVGSGPISWMGWRLSRPDLFFESIPVDPLGHLYRRILDEQHPPGLQPTANGGPSRAVPARPLALRAEALTSLFAHNSFDMVASRNAIDHSQDPLRCLSEMVATVKPGRFVVLELFEREGAIQNYRDLHICTSGILCGRRRVGSSSEGKERDSRACSRYCARRLRRSTAAGGIVRRLALGQHPRCTKGAFTKKRAGNARYRVF